MLSGMLKPIKEWMNLKVGYRSNLICHQCRVRKESALEPLRASRHTAETFRQECVHRGELSAFVLSNKF